MKRRSIAGAAVGLVLLSTSAFAQLSDGDFDALAVGTAPDCGVDAGAWTFPVAYIDAGLCEAVAGDFQIIATSDVVPGAVGNSLLNASADPVGNYHLANLFDAVILEGDGAVTFSFDIFVPSTAAAGGSVYIGGDHGGSGFSNLTDRGPQLAWFAGGALVAVDATGGTVVLVPAYAIGVWQSLRLEIDLVADTYDAYYGADGAEPELIGAGLTFRSLTQDFLDRVSIAHFAALGTSGAAFDNIEVVVKGACPADLDGTGDVGFTDLLAVLANWGPCPGCPEDIDGSGDVGFTDLLTVLAAWGPCA